MKPKGEHHWAKKKVAREAKQAALAATWRAMADDMEDFAKTNSLVAMMANTYRHYADRVDPRKS